MLLCSETVCYLPPNTSFLNNFIFRTWFAAWIAALQVNLTELLGEEDAKKFVAKNLETFGWCDDRRTLLSMEGLRDYIWFEVLEIDVIEYVDIIDEECKLPEPKKGY